MNQEIFNRRNPTQKTYSKLGCKQWSLIIGFIFLAPVFVFIVDLFFRWVVAPWNESITVSQHQDLVDRSFSTEQPCKAPCWYNLHLGVSSESEVKDTLKMLPFVDQNRIKEWDITLNGKRDAKEILYYCSYLADKTCGGIILSQGKFVQVSTRIDYSLTFQTVIERFGSPNYYSMFPGIEFQKCQINLHWVVDGLELLATSDQYFNCPFDSGIDPDVQVNSLAYSLEDVNNRFEKYSDVYHPWRGFLEP